MLADQPTAAPAPARAPAAPMLLAQHLRIAVAENGRSRAELAFGAAAVEWLADLVPPEVAEKRAARGIDVAEIARTAVLARCAPSELFQLQEGGKVIRVWLE